LGVVCGGRLSKLEFREIFLHPLLKPFAQLEVKVVKFAVAPLLLTLTSLNPRFLLFLVNLLDLSLDYFV
jgi:hypothetical protein